MEDAVTVLLGQLGGGPHDLVAEHGLGESEAEHGGEHGGSLEEHFEGLVVL